MEFDVPELFHPTNFTSATTEDTTDLLNIISELLNTVEEDKHQMPGKPYVTIVDEPATNLYRFRYRSEGETAGSIPGEKQQTGRKSSPKIMVCNHDGLAALEVCCLTVRKTVLRNIIKTLSGEKQENQAKQK